MSSKVYVAKETSTHDPRPYGFSPATRLKQITIVGGDREFKDVLLWNILRHDLREGSGFALIDPDGSLTDRVLNCIPSHRTNSTILFRPADRDYPIGFNPLKGVPHAVRPRATQELLSVFQTLWELDYKHTPLLLDLLRNSLRPLFDFPGATLLSLTPFLTNQLFRKRVIERCTDPFVRAFWRNEFDGTWSQRDRIDKPASVLTRVRTLLADPTIRNVLAQTRAPLNFHTILERDQVFIADLSETNLGSETTMLFGALLGAQLRVAVSARPTDVGSDLKPFYIIASDCERLDALSYSRLLQTPGTAQVGVLLTTSQLEQHEKPIQGQLARAGTVISFRCTSDDARTLEPLFSGIAQPQETLMNLEADRICASDYPYPLAVMTQAATPGHQRRCHARRTAIISRTRSRLCQPRQRVEARIERFLAPKSDHKRQNGRRL